MVQPLVLYHWTKEKNMKRMYALLAGAIFSVTIQAQVVNISVQGNRNEQVIVNNVTYNIENNTTTNLSKNITLNNLRPGEYSLRLIRINDNNVNDDKVPLKDNNVIRTTSVTSFTVRPGYDVAIAIFPNGIVQVKDKQIIGTTSDPRIVMADRAFNSLLSDIQYHWRNTRRITAAQTALTNNNNYFSTAQVMQILNTVDGEANRLFLAKLAYNRIVDPGSFSQVYTVMTLPTSRDDLSSFIRQGGNNTNSIYSYSESFRLEISDAVLDAHIVKIKSIVDANLRANAVTEILSNTTHYFTVSQVRRLLEMVESESVRLKLLRDVYTHITDPENFGLVYSLLATDASKLQLIDYIKTAAANSGIINYNLNKPAMDDKEFAEILRVAKDQAARGGLISYITNELGDFANYFTAEQAAMLIHLADGELNRLGLAKTAYRGVTDPQNFLPLMNELLVSPLTINELNIYAYSYRPNY
jgi:hypothetical protein